MRDMFTKSMARNIYYGGSVFFILLFLALTFQTHRAWPERSKPENITPDVVKGKQRGFSGSFEHMNRTASRQRPQTITVVDWLK